ncbi:MAG: hypothetical protein WC308_04735 [archaeon]|jgi:hypothetical protein
MKIENWFEVQNGVKIWNEIENYKKSLSNLPNGRYFVLIEKIENIRSREQNNAMWAIPYSYFEKALIDAGIFKNPSKQDVHIWCMVQCLPCDYKQRIFEEWQKIEPVINYKSFESYKEPFRLTSTKMKTTDAMHYYENLQMFYSENFSSGEENDFIPDPVKNYRSKF